MMDFPVHIALRDALSRPEGWDSGWVEVYEALANDFLYPIPAHWWSSPKPRHPRLLAQLDGDVGLWKLAMAFVATTRGTPQFYYGSEVLLRGPKTTQRRRTARGHARRLGGRYGQRLHRRTWAPNNAMRRSGCARCSSGASSTPVLHGRAGALRAARRRLRVLPPRRPGHGDGGAEPQPANDPLALARFARFLPAASTRAMPWAGNRWRWEPRSSCRRNRRPSSNSSATRASAIPASPRRPRAPARRRSWPRPRTPARRRLRRTRAPPIRTACTVFAAAPRESLSALVSSACAGNPRSTA